MTSCAVPVISLSSQEHVGVENHVVESKVHVIEDVQDAGSDESADSDESFGLAEESTESTNVLSTKPTQPLAPPLLLAFSLQMR